MHLHGIDSIAQDMQAESGIEALYKPFYGIGRELDAVKKPDAVLAAERRRLVVALDGVLICLAKNIDARAQHIAEHDIDGLYAVGIFCVNVQVRFIHIALPLKAVFQAKNRYYPLASK